MPLMPDIDTILPPIDIEHLATQAMHSHGAVALYSGYGILTLGLVMRLVHGYWRALHDESPRYLEALVVTGFFAALIAGYAPFATTIIKMVTSLGHGYVGGPALDEAIYQRMQAYDAYDALHGGVQPLSFLSVDGFVTGTLKAATLFLYICLQATAFMLRCLQYFGLAVIVAYGPLLLGAASLGPFTMSLAIGWFWALVEVSAWSLTSDILIKVFGDFARKIPTDFYAATEILMGLVMIALFFAVPIFTSMLIRSSSAASMSQSTALVTLGAARMAMRAGKASPAYKTAQTGIQAASRLSGAALGRGTGAAASWMRGKMSSSGGGHTGGGGGEAAAAATGRGAAAPSRGASVSEQAAENYLNRKER